MTDKELLEYIPHGKKNRVSGWELQRVGGYKNIRVFRDVIRRLRKNGEIIAATKSNGGGYYIPDSREELAEYIREAEKQGASTFAPLKAAREKLREGEGQVDICDLVGGEAAAVAEVAYPLEGVVANGK